MKLPLGDGSDKNAATILPGANDAAMAANADDFPATAPTPLAAYKGKGEAWLTVGLWAVVAFLLGVLNENARLLFPGLPADGTRSAHALAAGYLALLLVSLLFTARSAAHLPHRAGFLIAVGAVLAAPVGAVVLMHQMHVFVPPLIAVSANNLFLPVAAALAGAGVGRVIRHPNTLLAAAGFAVFFDIVMVTMGTVALLLKNNSHVVTAFSVGGGVAGAPYFASRPGFVAPPPPLTGVTIGPADVLFLGLFLSAIAYLRLSERATLAWMLGLLALAVLIPETTGLPVPALAPMGVAVLLANWRQGAFTRQEKRDLAIGATFAVFLAGLLVAGARGVLGGGKTSAGREANPDGRDIRDFSGGPPPSAPAGRPRR